ncbi:hypothetical protein ACSV4D_17450 [Flavobacterium sp. ARAG 55.4]|uniref:hypothetical protein n=1 Tax=Flavobacterium sp. ARAG 55.4 TaxID=3451357 RepID=UPI003F45761B
MAWVIIGGLSSSLVLTLVLVPVMYMIIERLRLKVNSWFGKEDVDEVKLHNPVEIID